VDGVAVVPATGAVVVMAIIGRWFGECRKHGRYLWHPHGKRCPVCGERDAR
jgi:hypothetical protein